MTHTLGMKIPPPAWRLGSSRRRPFDDMNLMSMEFFLAWDHKRRSIERSLQRPRRTSSHEKAMIMPVSSNGMPRSNAYDAAAALPFRANRLFSEPGDSWMPLCSTPLLRVLVSQPAELHCSRTMIRSGRLGFRWLNSLATAQPTTPAPIMPMSYESMVPAFSIQKIRAVAPRPVDLNGLETVYAGFGE